ncbi:Luciferase-like monooxygenase [Streptomyces sp. Ncost-T6T-2b]|nr:Luciferase-like monooxygenase [Streptomyces sp. Ncost-T6T-2b]
MDDIRGDETSGDASGRAADGDGIRGAAAGTATVPLSVLDLVTVGQGRTATQALRTSVEIAKLTESRGFHRFWVAEHHSMPGVAVVLPGRRSSRTSPPTPSASASAPAGSCCPTTPRW